MTKWQEFARGWPVLLAASFGVGVGVSSLLTYNSGLFANDLSTAIGLSRTEFGTIYFLATIAIALAMPAVGWLVDRYGVRWPTVAGAAGLSLTYICLALFTQSVATYALLMVLLGLLGALSTSVSFTRAVTSWFDQGRGLALGITQAGIGLSASIVPLIIAVVIRDHGWRAGFLALGVIAALGIPSALIALKTRETAPDTTSPRKSAADFTAVRRSGLFWLQGAAFALTTLTFLGMVVHFVPMLRDTGMSMMDAAPYAGLIGISVLLSRLVVGWLADMVHAPWLAASACLLGGAGCLALLADPVVFAPFAAVTIGCAVGAEIDLLGYLTARYFGLGVYGRAYAWQYAGVICASGASPAWMGWIADRSGYDNVLLISGFLSLIAVALFMMLPRDARASQTLGVEATES